MVPTNTVVHTATKIVPSGIIVDELLDESQNLYDNEF